LRTAALQLKTPMLGVCLGMQLLANSSEEGRSAGLGLIDAEVLRIPAGDGIKVPHIGWAVVAPAGDAPLFVANQAERFYFVHSYYMRPTHEQDVAATVHYGQDLCVAVSKANIHGVQFHPEKSHRYGMRLLQKFAELTA
ncbi:MAG: imidazole glycerol phosphate synthase subunit HisH, partial [Pandoraea sp.]|nr:imidazole glycerol phosphate synthase subunit HisH [Pandoraea sp.]